MKLKEVLPYLDRLETVTINVEECNGKVTSTYFSGAVMDIPWVFGEMELVNNDFGEAITLDKIEENGNEKIIGFGITVKENKDE